MVATGVILGVSIVGVLPIYLTGALAPAIRSAVGWSATQLGAAIGAHFVVSALCAVFAGRTADRLGWRRTAFGALAVGAVALGGAAVAPNGMVLAACLGLSGLSNALAVPTGNVAILASYGPRRRALVFGLKQAAVPAATLLAALAVPLAAAVGWRWLYSAASVVPVACLLSLWRLRAGGRPVTRPPPDKPGRPAPTLLVLAVAGGLGTAMAAATATFLVSGALAAGLGVAAAGRVLMLASLAGIAARVAMGWLVDRGSGDGLGAMALSLAGGAVGLVTLASGRGAVYGLGAVLAFAAGWGWPGLLQYSVSAANTERAGAATGTVQVGLTIGAALGPLLFGWVVDHQSYRLAWLAASTTAAVAATATLLARRVLARQSQPAARRT